MWQVLEHTQLAEMHSQAGLAMRKLSEQHELMRAEVEAPVTAV